MKEVNYEKIREDIHERFSETFNKLHVSELKDEIQMLNMALSMATNDVNKYLDKLEEKREIITELNHTIEELQSRLPEGMRECTIIFEQCEVGHGYLRGTNWIKHDCPWCEIAKLKEQNKSLKYRVDHAEWLVEKYRDETND